MDCLPHHSAACGLRIDQARQHLVSHAGVDAGSPIWSSSMPTGSSGAASATAPSLWSRERDQRALAGQARGFLASGSGRWTLLQLREQAMARADPARAGLTIRCAIYTRKSSDEGLEEDFNSLNAQREACEAYIVSQRHAGWVTLADMYDDGGLSGVQAACPASRRSAARVWPCHGSANWRRPAPASVRWSGKGRHMPALKLVSNPRTKRSRESRIGGGIR